MFASVRTLLLGGMIGKALGIVRELISASLLGTGSIAAAFRLSQAAFVIPLNGLLAEALTSGFTPTYSRERAEYAVRSRALFAGMHAVLLAFSTSMALLVATLAIPWVRLLAPGFDAHTVRLTSQMVQVMAWAMPPYALTSLCAAAELAAGRADMAAARASIQSLGLIAGTVLAWWLSKPILIPVGFVLAYVWLAGWSLKSVLSDSLRLWPRAADWLLAIKALDGVWRAFRVVVWVPLLMQVHFVVERRVASVVNANAVAALDYARFVSDTAVLLLAMPFGLAGLGAMARMDERQFHDAAWRSSRILLSIGIPLSAALAVNADWVVKLIFARGAFGAASVATTAAILRGFAAGLWAQLVGYAGVKFLSARSHNRAVVTIYTAALACNIAFNLLLARVIGVAALGAASAVSSLVLGLAILARLNLLSSLRRDLVALISAAAGYIALSLVVSTYMASNSWMPPVLFAGYWCIAGSAIPPCREAFADIWKLARSA